MLSTDEGGRASLMDATSKAGCPAVCAQTIRANNKFMIERLHSLDFLTHHEEGRVGYFMSVEIISLDDAVCNKPIQVVVTRRNERSLQRCSVAKKYCLSL